MELSWSMMKKLLFSSLLFLYSSGVHVLCNDFNCTSLPPLSRQASTVHELRPQDIKVVMAFGDSITAGELIKFIDWLDIYCYRFFNERDSWPWYYLWIQGKTLYVGCNKLLHALQGLSWSIGGDPNATTIPGFLKTYTPDLIGASLKSHILEVIVYVTLFILLYFAEIV